MDHQTDHPSRWGSPFGIFMVIAGALGAYYLLTEHLTHVTQAVPYLFLLACPLMHLFHGHGHGHGSHQHRQNADGSSREEPDRP